MSRNLTMRSELNLLVKAYYVSQNFGQKNSLATLFLVDGSPQRLCLSYGFI